MSGLFVMGLEFTPYCTLSFMLGVWCFKKSSMYHRY